MNRISLIGMIFGLILISFLSFMAGFLSSYLFPKENSSSLHSSVPASAGGADVNTSKVTDPAQGSVAGNTPTSEPNKASLDTSQKSDGKSITAPGVIPTTAAQDIESETLKGAIQRIPDPDDQGKFSIQIKGFSERLWATQMMRALKRLGYGVYVVRIPIQDRSQGFGSSFYDVRAGVFENYVQANQFARELRRLGHHSASVTMIDGKMEVVASAND